MTSWWVALSIAASWLALPQGARAHDLSSVGEPLGDELHLMAEASLTFEVAR